MFKPSRLAALVLGVCLAGLALGCGKSEPTTPDAPNPMGGGEPSSGNAVFDNNCAKCHFTKEGASGSKKKGPNLAKVGAAPGHTVEWLADHVKDPKSHKPGSGMPPFDGKLSAEEIKSVAEFMSGLK